MTKKELFIDYLNKLIERDNEQTIKTYEDGDREAILTYLEAFKVTDGGKPNKPAFTDNGKLVLTYMKDNPTLLLKARDIAEAIAVSSRMVSGAMRKLVEDGYVEKIGQDPVIYKLTEKGIDVVFD